MRINLLAVALAPAVLVSGLASLGFAHDKSHKEAWSDPAAEQPFLTQRVTADGMTPFYTDMQPHPIAAHGAGPMVAALGNRQGARLLVQGEGPPGAAPGTAGAVAGAAASESEREGEKLTDEKILHVAHVANTGEIDQAKLATTKATDPRVRQYAKMMIQMHTAAEKKEADVVRRRSLTMVASKTSDNLVKNGKSTLDMLKGKSGAEFDRAYMDAQVTNHQEVLNLIDTRLSPSANDKDVKQLVAGLRPTVQSHLDQAKTIQSKLDK